MDLKVEPKPADPKPARPKPSVLNYYARNFAAEARRFRQGLTRENIKSFLNTMAWTLPLTVLIWVYAESEQQVEDKDRSIYIAVVSKDPSKIVTIDSREKVIICDLKGPRSNIDQFDQSQSPNKPITIALDTRSLAEGDNSIPTLDSLKTDPRFTNAGITIEACTPSFLTVNMDTLIQNLPMPVHAPNLPGLPAAKFDPATVQVSGPSRALEHMSSVTADITALASINVPGTHTGEVTALISDPANDLKFNPPEVKATFTVQEKDESYTVEQGVPIYYDIPQDIMDKDSITLNNSGGFVPNLHVIGPPDEIEKLKQGLFRPRAILEINDDTLRNSNSVPLKFDLPPNVRVDGAIPQVGFTATPRG
jgi:hypothetical protein